MVHTRKKIVLLCSRLDLPGGIERAVVNTAHLFQRKGQKVTLLILDETSEIFYPLNDEIQVIHQKASFGITRTGNIITRKLTLLSDVLRLRRILKNLGPDVVITTEYPITVATILTGVSKKCPVLTWEHHHYHWVEKNQFWKKLSALAYQRVNTVICLNKEEAALYNNNRTVVIPNFVEPLSLENSARLPVILTVGWLIPRKGIDLLLKIASGVLSGNPGWKWKLVGKGEMRDEVMRFIAEDPNGDRLILQDPGSFQIENEYRQASIFALTSRFEAFPMVLLEAMANGLPCVSFNCPSGPGEIILHEKNGLLVEAGNTEAFSLALTTLIRDEHMRDRMSGAAAESIARYSPDKIYEMWENLFVSLSRSESKT